VSAALDQISLPVIAARVNPLRLRVFVSHGTSAFLILYGPWDDRLCHCQIQMLKLSTRIHQSYAAGHNAVPAAGMDSTSALCDTKADTT
jgi:hypothetical protein